jgi:hypothetical protein
MQNINNTFGGLGVEITEANKDNNSTVVTRVTGTGCVGNFGTKTGIKRYYTIVPTTDAGLNGTMVFHYFDTEITGHTEANIKIFKSTDNRSHWTLQNSTIDVTNNKTTQTGITSFSDWTASDATNNSLPIELTDFNVHVKNNSVVVNWITATETNNDYFTLERSLDGDIWTTIYTCDGAGTSTKEHQYTFTDYSPYSGVNYYRLKQTDIDAQFTYSFVKSAEIKSDSISFVVYPEPASIDEINILIKGSTTETASIEINDMYGRQMCSGKVEISKGPVLIKLSDICNLSPGTYIVSVKGNNLLLNKKIIVK